jgi:hypothetical protein
MAGILEFIHNLMNDLPRQVMLIDNLVRKLLIS